MAAVVVCGGCATEPVRWDSAAETVVPATAATMTKAPDKPVSARDYAARFSADVDCEAEVRRIGKRNVELGLQLLRACVDRGDFRRLSALIDGSWVTTLVSRPEGPSLCARVIAARGGDVDADVTSCQSVGYPVLTLEQAVGAPDAAVGKLVILRAQLDAELKSKKDTRLVEVALDDRGLSPQPTGRRIAAQFGAQTMPRGDAVLLARVVKVIEDTLTDDGELVTVVDVIMGAPAAARPTF